MDWVTGIQKAIDYIEDNLLTDLDFEEIAKQAYISGFHFQRVFHILSGFTVGEYIRNRRLSLAASELFDTDARIIDTALKYGYDSPESFSRAFMRFHGVSPTAARELGTSLKSFTRFSIKVILEGGSIMDYKIEDKPPFKLLAKYEKIDIDNPAISAFWGQCAADGTIRELKEHSSIFESLHKTIIGVADATSFDGKKYSYYIGTPYDGDIVPEGFTIIEIPAQTWGVFRCVDLDDTAINANMFQKIYSEFFPTSNYEPVNRYQLEVFPNGEIDSKSNVDEIWITIQKKKVAPLLHEGEYIKNDTLRNHLKKMLGKDNIAQSDVLSIRELNLNGTHLSDISDFWKFQNVVKLELRENGITDFSPLAGLTELRYLNIGNDPWNKEVKRNIIRNADFFKNLSNLEFLDVSHTKLKDISFVQFLPNLKQIECMCNYISDLSPLVSCPKLRAMCFYSCRLWEIEVCRFLPELEGISVNENGIQDLSPLADCANLKVLNVHSNKIGSIDCIKGLTKLTYVTLDQNNLNDISALRNMPDINHLTISLIPYLHDISVLKELKNLKYCEAANLDLTPEQKAELQAEHPGCHFVWGY